MYEEGNFELWSTPIANSERQGFQEYVYKEGWVAIFNCTDKEQTAELKGKFLSFMPKGIYNLKYVWGTQSVTNYSKGDKLGLKIAANGVVFFKYSQVQ